MRDRSWLPFLVALGLVAAGLVVVFAFRSSPLRCASSAANGSPLLSVAGMREQPDDRLDTLSAAVGRMAAPFGPVRAGVGYDYGQWLHLYGVGDGLLALTKNNAPMVFLDASLRARWALRPAAKRTAWDASANRFVLLDLAKDRATRVGSYALSSGEERWCVEVSARHRDGQPVATTFLDNGDVLVALPSGKNIEVTSLRGGDGQARWTHTFTGVGRGDFLGALDDDTVVLGGVEEYRLAQPAPSSGARVLTAFGATDGKPRWTYADQPGSRSHVAGLVDGRVILVTASAGGSSLSALSDGKPVWTIHPRDSAVESTVRGSVVLMRSKAGLDAYDVASGRALWHRVVPTSSTYFPYGFSLGQMPSLDEAHVLMPTTSALRVLDVRDGTDVAFPLPTDGIRTTYWPYQLAVTDKLIGVVTNTGGVVTTRE
ncbi:MAG: PQQ-binding-like beta-propeller repeat protein [Nocardioidaceae bacterium]|nr:PQQ-binding-like beta-propeller repeat protein [Nocardioidaceae bacterium]